MSTTLLSNHQNFNLKLFILIPLGFLMSVGTVRSQSFDEALAKADSFYLTATLVWNRQSGQQHKCGHGYRLRSSAPVNIESRKQP